MNNGSLQSQCMFYEEAKCYFHASFPTECKLCFNFSTGYKVVDKGKVKSVYTLMDYIKSTGDKKLFFPKGDGIQSTL